MVPPGLVPYLPTGFSFQRKPSTRSTGRTSCPPNGGPTAGHAGGGRRRRPPTPRLQHALENALGNKLPFINVGGTLTFIIVGPDGNN